MQAPLADGEKRLLMLYSRLRRAITPLHETALNPSSLSSQIIPLLNLVILDDKDHDKPFSSPGTAPSASCRPLPRLQVAPTSRRWLVT
jgi:hypothetical protein